MEIYIKIIQVLDLVDKNVKVFILDMIKDLKENMILMSEEIGNFGI